MRKKVFGKQLSRNRKSRIALLKTLSREVILKGEVTTTLAKAKAVQTDLEKLMGLAKKADISAKRMAYSFLGNDREASNALFTKYQSLTSTRGSGFTRIIALPARRGDAAEMARIGWVEEVSLSATDDKKK